MGNGIVGLIGIGRLGSAIAHRLLAGGFQVIGYDESATALTDFREAGGEASTFEDIAQRCNRVIACLPNHKTTRNAAAGLASGTVLIDLTNATPAESTATAKRLLARGIRYLDAPVCEWHQTVRERGGKVLCGGDEETVKACADIFATFARPLVYAGRSGSGTATKRDEEKARAATHSQP